MQDRTFPLYFTYWNRVWTQLKAKEALAAVSFRGFLLDKSTSMEDQDCLNFCLYWLSRIRVYAAPLLNEQAGIDTITSHARQSFDCLRYSGSFHPEYSVAVSFIADINQQAYDIYLLSVSTTSTDNSLAGLIEKFKSTWAAFPPNSPGQHVLVWAPFIAPAVS